MTSRSRVRQLSINGLQGCLGSLYLLLATEAWFKSHSCDMKLDSCCLSSWLIEEGAWSSYSPSLLISPYPLNTRTDRHRPGLNLEEPEFLGLNVRPWPSSPRTSCWHRPTHTICSGCGVFILLFKCHPLILQSSDNVLAPLWSLVVIVFRTPSPLLLFSVICGSECTIVLQLCLWEPQLALAMEDKSGCVNVAHYTAFVT